MDPSHTSVGLNAVLTTDELGRRSARSPDYAAEARALADLAGTLAEHPRALLQRLSELAMELCRADSAGVSILEQSDGPGVFRLYAIAGEFAHSRWSTIARDASPSGVVLERDTPLLFAYPERHFPYPVAVDPPIAEMLLVPFHTEGQPVGTVWVIAHTPDHQFDSEDARRLTSLSRFAAAAWQTVAALDAAQTAKADLERRVEERTGEVRESRQKYRALFDSIDEGFCVLEVLFDPAGTATDFRFLEVNAAFEGLTGLRNPVGRTMRELMPRHDGESLAMYGCVSRTGRPERFVTHARYLNDRWYDVYAFRVDGHVGVLFTDITARKQADDAVRASEARFRTFADTAPAMLWVTEPDGSCSFLSRAWYEFTGQTEAAGLGFGWLDAVHPDDRVASHDTFLDANARHQPFALEHRLRRVDGEYRWVVDTGRPRTGPDGEFLGYIGAVFDIDDRKRAEAELFRSREALRAILDTIPQRVFWKAHDLTYLGCNRQFAQDMGFDTPEQVVGKTDFEGSWVAAAEAYRADDRRVIDAATPKLDFEETLPAADGRVSWVRTSKVPLYDPNGKVVGVLGTYEDVTERKRAEDVIRASEARQAFLLALSDAVWPLSDPSAVQEVAGQLLGTRLQTDRAYYCDVDESADAIRIVRDFVRNGVNSLVGRYSFEAFGWVGPAFRTGRPMVVNDVATTPLLADADRPPLAALPVGAFVAVPLVKGGQLVALLCVSDVAPRVWAAAEVELVVETAERTWAAVEQTRVGLRLREQEHLLQEAAELAHVGGWSFDPVTQEGDWTAETARIHGVDPAIPPGVAASLSRFEGEHRARLEAALKEATVHGTPYDLELRFTAVTGEQKWVRAICRPTVEEGKVVRVRGSLQDVTARHVLEQQLRQSQKMEAFGQLAGGVAHDFNNMLQVINGYAALALEQLAVGNPLIGLLGEVQKAGERSATLTRQLLAFARQQVAAPKVIDLGSAVVDTAGMLRRLIGEDVRLVTDLSTGLYPVFADPGQVEQVLLNFAVNARDAMPKGGTLTLATRNEVVSPEAAAEHLDAKAGPHAVLSVTDTGTGMSPEVMSRIFEPFFTTKGVGKGTGLGLATVYGIVKQAGGHVRVKSKEGEGSTFEVYLPRTQQAESEISGKSGIRSLARGKETVLVVEDEAAVRGLVKMVLTGCGYTVLEADDGASAESVAAGYAGPIHLVLSDVVMPGAGGPQAVMGVLSKHPEAKVIFMSGYTDDAVVRHGVMVATEAFLPKPFTPLALAHKVREVLDG